MENQTQFLGFKDIYKNLESDKKKSSIPFLTKYEKSRIIGIRAQQINKGSPILVDISNYDEITPKEIALLELKEKKIPIIIRRTMPNGTFEDWRIDELKLDLN